MAKPPPLRSHRRVALIIRYNGRYLYEDLRDRLTLTTPITDFDQVWVAVARTWAKKNHKKWPPRPRAYPLPLWGED